MGDAPDLLHISEERISTITREEVALAKALWQLWHAEEAAFIAAGELPGVLRVFVEKVEGLPGGKA